MLNPKARISNQGGAFGAGAARGDEPAVDLSRFELTVLATGLHRPMEICVGPDGVVYSIEL
ncbi:MAG: hypothetical protein ACKPEY_10655, partial [Planctomycetota bacterium]